MWISLVVPPAVLLLAMFLQRLEASVLAVPDLPDPLTVEPESDAAGADQQPAPLAVGPEPAARPVCAAHRRFTRASRVTA